MDANEQALGAFHRVEMDLMSPFTLKTETMLGTPKQTEIPFFPPHWFLRQTWSYGIFNVENITGTVRIIFIHKT